MKTLFSFTRKSFFVNFATHMKNLPCLFLLMAILVLPLPLSGQTPETIVQINVVGNERIDKGAVTANVKSKEGDPVSLELLREDMKRIYKTGFFSDVQIDLKDNAKGKIVTFVVVERLPVRDIFVQGNKKIKTADITEKLKVKTNTVLNTERVKESMDEIRKLYASKGYYAVKVSYTIEYDDRGRAILAFAIEEPEISYVRKITFTGNKVFKEGKLKGYIRTREKGWFSWFTGSGILDEDALEDDRKNLEAVYADNGYVRANVGVPEVTLSQDGKSISINIPIEEGPVFKTGTIDFSGDILFPKEELLAKLKTKPQVTFRSSLYQEDITILTDVYQDQGYAFCEITPLTGIDDNTRLVNLTFNIKKNQEIYINRINILGNVRTRDKVVRRELRFAEGDRFSSTGLKNSKKRLKNTTYFKDVDFKLIKTDEPDKVNMDITLEERPTGHVSAGLGYSSTDKVVVTGSVAQENLLGTGRKVFLEAALGSITQEFKLSYLEPYLFDRDFALGLSAFNFTRDMDTYTYKRLGGSVSVWRPLTEEIRAGLRYRYEQIRVSNITWDASSYIKDQRGTTHTSSGTVSLTKNSIDDVMNPTSGVNADISFELAGGPFGGTNDFHRTIAYYGRYFPIKFLDSSFFVRGTAGTIQAYGGKQIPVFEKFYVGGLHSVRGFKYGEAGPTDDTGEVIGSKNELYFNTEWIFPIYKPAGIKGVVFYDLGAGFDDNKGFTGNGLRSGAGVGFRWFSPLGPIRLELGFNLFPKSGERRSVFDFAIGTQY
jgi:outer membrane protein insertion porin family